VLDVDELVLPAAEMLLIAIGFSFLDASMQSAPVSAGILPIYITLNGKLLNRL
jgi:hypothetical protein